MCQLINNKVHFLEFSKCNEMLYRWRVFWRDQETLSRALRAWSFVLGGSSLRPRADLTFHVLLFPERNKKKTLYRSLMEIQTRKEGLTNNGFFSFSIIFQHTGGN